MSSVTTYSCDKCKRNLKYGEKNYIEINSMIMCLGRELIRGSYDLCEDCLKEVINYMGVTKGVKK